MKAAKWLTALAWAVLAVTPVPAAPAAPSPAASGCVNPGACASAPAPYVLVPLGAVAAPAVARPSPEAEAMAKLAEGTVNDVHQNTEFLASLWKWTTVAAALVLAVLSAFGIKTVSDLRQAKDDALEAVRLTRESLVQMQGNFDRLSREITANHAAMMNCMEERRAVSELSADEAFRVAAGASGDPAFQRSQEKGYRAVQARLQAMLLDEPPTGPQIASHVYDLLGFAHYKLGNVSAALAAVSKALDYREGNDTARYNAASYCGRLGLADQCVAHLKRAIEINQDHRDAAKLDTDFDAVRANPAFQALVGP